MTNLLNQFDDIKNQIIKLQNDLQQKTEENFIISKKNNELQEEINNLNKVSMVAGLNRQVSEKNRQIEILERQLYLSKNKKLEENKNINLLSEDELEEGYELITYQEHKLLKNTENRKLYYLDDKGKKGKYAGKESSKGKIKLKE